MWLICYENCSNCKKIEKIMEDKKLSFEKRDIKRDNPNQDEIKHWHEMSGEDIKKFFNTSGVIYRDNNLKDKLPDMSLEEKYELLSRDGMLVKRPILIHNDRCYVGPRVKDFIESL